MLTRTAIDGENWKVRAIVAAGGRRQKKLETTTQAKLIAKFASSRGPMSRIDLLIISLMAKFDSRWQVQRTATLSLINNIQTFQRRASEKE